MDCGQSYRNQQSLQTTTQNCTVLKVYFKKDFKVIELNYLKVGLTIFISIFLSLLSYHFFEKYLLVTKQEKVTPVVRISNSVHF